jgi:hypothetical protein
MARKRKQVLVDLDSEFQSQSDRRPDEPKVEIPADLQPRQTEDKGNPCRKLKWKPPQKKNTFNERKVAREIPQDELDEIKITKCNPRDPELEPREAATKMKVECIQCHKIEEKYPSEIGALRSYICTKCIARNRY